MAKRGRPKSLHPTEKVNIRLSRPAFDAACLAAKRARLPLAKLIRLKLERHYLPSQISETTQVH